MTRVKSALEIALERAKTISVSDNERQRYKILERAQQARELIFKLLEGSLSIATIVDWTTTEGAGEQTMRRSALALVATNKFSERKHLDKLFELLAKLGLSDADKIKRQVLDILDKNLDSAASRADKAKGEFLQGLRKRGIRGSAIVPKVAINSDDQSESIQITEESKNLLATMRRWCLNAMNIEEMEVES